MSIILSTAQVCVIREGRGYFLNITLCCLEYLKVGIPPLKWNVLNSTFTYQKYAASIDLSTNDLSHCVLLKPKHPIRKRVYTNLYWLSSPGSKDHIKWLGLMWNCTLIQNMSMLLLMFVISYYPISAFHEMVQNKHQRNKQQKQQQISSLECHSPVSGVICQLQSTSQMRQAHLSGRFWHHETCKYGFTNFPISAAEFTGVWWKLQSYLKHIKQRPKHEKRCHEIQFVQFNNVLSNCKTTHLS